MKPIPQLFYIFLLAVILLAVTTCSRSKTTPAGEAANGTVQVAAADTAETGNSAADPGDENTAGASGFDDEGFGGDAFDEFEEEFGEPEEVWDPLEGYNRFMTGVNDKLYLYLLNPVARGYSWILPEGPRRGIDRFFTNLLYPVRAVNNLLQLKFKNTGEETLRFVINSTIGILGFWDPAKDAFGLEPHPEDFGQTLGYWGIGGGPHLVLPVLGPSNLRDSLSLYPDYVYLDPKSRLEGTEQQLMLKAFDTVNNTSLHLGEYESLKKDAVDYYSFFRDLYEQNRKNEIEE